MLEIIIAIGVMTIGISACSGIMIATTRGAEQVRRHTAATSLANEGIEAALSIRDRGWDGLTVGTHGLALQASPSEWVFSGTADNTDGLTRVVTVSSVDANTMKVSVVVSWVPQGGRQASVQMQSILTKWPFL